MFTGIIQQLGTVISRSPGRLVLDVGDLADTCRLGDSLAVSGTCLTVVEIEPPRLTMDVLAETEERTNLSRLEPGDRVNLEPALKAGEGLGGHFVTGHVDGPARLLARESTGRDWILRVRVPAGQEKFVVEKGSIALDGVSLTVAAVEGDEVSVHVIPYTFSHTSLSSRPVGARLNLETDLLGKYVARQLEGRETSIRPIDVGFLEEMGFM
ncbi:MAG: riboflavin synthase [Candidatus Erginobacter occultus]|nr:riboflavin synthase [Candidatus Erginobacter occultus]